MRLKTITESNLLYHGTDRIRVPDILQHGLDPAKSTYAQDEEANDAEDFGPPYSFVYLTDNIDVARNFAPGGDTHMLPDISRKAIFAVHLPFKMRQQLITNRGEFIRAPFRIPPKYLQLIE